MMGAFSTGAFWPRYGVQNNSMGCIFIHHHLLQCGKLFTPRQNSIPADPKRIWLICVVESRRLVNRSPTENSGTKIYLTF